MRSETHPQADGKPLMGLFSDLFRETSTLVHNEAELAKAELSEKVTQIGTGAAEMAIAGGVLFAGFLVLLFAAVGALDLMIDSPHAAWLAPLIVGVVVMIVGYALLKRGQHQVAPKSLAPERTLQALRDDARLAREHAR
jgi:putative superfamily III holin-X